MNKLIGLLLALLVTLPAVAQNDVAMADGLRSEGKIYVVVLIVLIVLAGLIGYLFLMDQKVKKLEKLLKERQKQTN